MCGCTKDNKCYVAQDLTRQVHEAFTRLSNLNYTDTRYKGAELNWRSLKSELEQHINLAQMQSGYYK